MLKTARVKNVISNPDVTPEILTYDSEAAAISNDSHATLQDLMILSQDLKIYARIIRA